MTGHGGRPHYVYLHSSKDGELLYVGMTSRPQQRPYQRSGRPWLTDEVMVDVSEAMSEFEATRAEYLLIQELQPPYNVQRGNGYVQWVVRAQQAVIAQFTEQEQLRSQACVMSRYLQPALGGTGADGDARSEAHESCLELWRLLDEAVRTGVAGTRAQVCA